MMGKVTIPCDISLDELKRRWDYMTGEAFYAGCDEVMDLGTFKKRKSDYVAAIIIAVLAFGFSQGIVDRQRYLALGIVCGAMALCFLLCRVSKRSQKPLAEFLDRISKGI